MSDDIKLEDYVERFEDCFFEDEDTFTDLELRQILHILGGEEEDGISQREAENIFTPKGREQVNDLERAISYKYVELEEVLIDVLNETFWELQLSQNTRQRFVKEQRQQGLKTLNELTKCFNELMDLYTTIEFYY